MTSLIARLRHWRFVAFLAAFTVTLGFGVTLATGQDDAHAMRPRTDEGTVAPAMSCAAMAQVDFGGIPGAPTELASATVMEAKDNSAGPWQACDVQGTIAPQLRFDLRLPMQGWQGKYLQAGCGAYCGAVGPINVPAANGCAPLTNGAFAVATDNEGHYGSAGFSAVFATDPTLRVDFGYQSEHELAVVAKAIIERFYGRPAAQSYFSGCSQGGHEALTEAQRYPRDFNGIIAGAPASIMTELNLWYQAWNALANLGPGNQPIVGAADLAPLHAAVVKACDPQDGTIDGLIADPLACTWDPGSIACDGRVPSAAAFCLTPEQVTAVRKLYDGPRDQKGELMYPGWQPRGSELSWAPWLVPTVPGAPTIDQTIAQETLRYVVYPDPHPTATVRDAEFTSARFHQILDQVKGIYDATDPDLSAFRDGGGKLILWHGWEDPAISPVGTIAYYQAVEQAMGGAARTQAFARLFLLPGVAHCAGGEGPDKFDALSAMVDWVTDGKAPDSLLTQQVDNNGKVTATRPVYPYPQIAVDTTGGPVNQAASYTPRVSTAQETLHVSWLGSFNSGYEKVCGWQEGRWVCRYGKSG
jgi:Tannase and feruloyl esterase